MPDAALIDFVPLLFSLLPFVYVLYCKSKMSGRYMLFGQIDVVLGCLSGIV
jgi:hypothetical protein